MGWYALAGAAALGALAAGARQARRRDSSRASRVRVAEAITINRPIEEVYAYWRDFGNFPRFMRHVESVQTSGRQSRWQLAGPGGVRIGWEAELVEDVEQERIAWRTLATSSIEHRGVVRFARAPGARGTEIRVDLSYRPPAGKAGRGLAWLLGHDPEGLIREDLRRFKQLMETGDVVVSDAPGMWRRAQPARTPSAGAPVEVHS